MADVQLPQKDTSFGTGGRFLSKIARSPTSASRKRRPPPSQGSETDTLPDYSPQSATQTQAATNSKRNLPRPGFPRQISAPDPSVPRLQRENTGPKHHSDATEETASQADAMLQRQQPPNAFTSHTPIVVPAKSVPTNNMSLAPLVSEYYTPPTATTASGHAPAVNYMYQQLYEMAQKRLATLQYMRRAHEGKMFWLNTVHFPKNDISRLPSYTPNRLSRRATNYFLLGISIPTVLDIHQLPQPGSPPQSNAAVAIEYLKSLNTLLAEFENYQDRHPTDGSHVGSLSRARLPSMFKRSATTSRPRKSSTAPSVEIGAQISPPAVPDTPLHQLQHNASHASIDTTAPTAVNVSFTSTTSASTLNNNQTHFAAGGIQLNNFSATATFPPPGPADSPNSSLLPNEAPYTHLLTPPLPFALDFYTVFATLCDVLIDAYQRLLLIVSGPMSCTATIADLFSKTDARIRKIMVAGIIKDFETAARDNAKKELNGVQKIVLGGLMG